IWRQLSSAPGGLARVNRRGSGGAALCARVAIPGQAQQFTDFGIDLCHHIRIVFQKLPRVLPPLSDPFTFVAVPGTALLHYVVQYAEVEQIAFARNTLTVDDVEFCLAERRSNFVLHDLDLGTIAG